MPLIPYPVRAYLKHLRHGGNRHDVHSPFVFALVENVLRKRTPPHAFAEIEAQRLALLKDNRIITVTDFGAGSRQGSGFQRSVSSIARTALKPKRQAEMLARLVDYSAPNTILELGTSLGITTLYLARSAASAQVHTIEGCTAIGSIAQENFTTAGTQNIHPHVGRFEDQLDVVLATLGRLDFAFIDGHHAKEPTLSYFDQCLAKAHNDTVFIFDDIHWSQGMDDAWSAIKAHPKVTVTIDLFNFGIVFLRKEQQREHFVLRY
ncbi:MAG: class I SAM-dependent methyltransferase [Flavobacteriales bacterium]|nr:class I SAM-dependent methyltransferase [Flavobacteriales bacterium]